MLRVVQDTDIQVKLFIDCCLNSIQRTISFCINVVRFFLILKINGCDTVFVIDIFHTNFLELERIIQCDIFMLECIKNLLRCDFTALLLNRYQSGSVGRLVTVDDQGTEIASLDISEEVRSLSANGRYLSVLYEDRLVIYNRELQIYATLHGPEHTREVLTRADGSVLMIASDSAQLFLP